MEMSIAERYSLFPIRDEVMYEFYKTQQAALWSSDEMDFSRDKEDYKMLSPELKRVVDHVNAFFSSTDGIIIDNIMLNFMKEAKTMEEQMFYGAQVFIECVHAETYSLIINTLIPEPEPRNALFRAADTVASVKAKDEWLIRQMGEKERTKRLLAFACGEGIFFVASFLFVFYFRHKNILQNIVFANEQISKDERLHRDAGVFLYTRDGKLEEEEAQKLVKEAVDLEIAFVDEILSEPIDNLFPEDVKNYVRFLGDHLLVSAGHKPLWDISSEILPSWINDISMEQKSNFYELRVGNYKQHSIAAAKDWKGRIEGASVKKNKAYADPADIDF